MNVSIESRNLIKSEQWQQFLDSTAAALQMNLIFLINETGESISVCETCPNCGSEVTGFTDPADRIMYSGTHISQDMTDESGRLAVFQLRTKYTVFARGYKCRHENDTLLFEERVDIAKNLIDSFLDILLSQWNGGSLESELATLHQINHIVLSMLRGDHKALERVIDLILSAAVVLLDAEGSWLEYDDGSGRKLLTKGYCSAADKNNRAANAPESFTSEIHSTAVRGILGVTMPADRNRMSSFLVFMVQECIIAFEINNLMKIMEAKLSIVLGAMDSLVLLIDRRKMITYANASAAKLLERRVHELVGLPASAIDAP